MPRGSLRVIGAAGGSADGVADDRDGDTAGGMDAGAAGGEASAPPVDGGVTTAEGAVAPGAGARGSSGRVSMGRDSTLDGRRGTDSTAAGCCARGTTGAGAGVTVGAAGTMATGGRGADTVPVGLVRFWMGAGGALEQATITRTTGSAWINRPRRDQGSDCIMTDRIAREVD